MQNCKCKFKNLNNNAFTLKLLTKIAFFFNKYLSQKKNLVNIIICLFILLYNYSAFAFDLSINNNDFSLHKQQQSKNSKHFFHSFNHFFSTINFDNNKIKNNKQIFFKTKRSQNNFFNDEINLRDTFNSQNIIIFNPNNKIENEHLLNKAKTKIELELLNPSKNLMQIKKSYKNEITLNKNHPSISSINIDPSIRGLILI